MRCDNQIDLDGITERINIMRPPDEFVTKASSLRIIFLGAGVRFEQIEKGGESLWVGSLDKKTPVIIYADNGGKKVVGPPLYINDERQEISGPVMCIECDCKRKG